MKCPKFGFELNDSLKKSYCKNCDWNCSGTITQSWFTSFKIEVSKRTKVNDTPQRHEKVNLTICPSCKANSLFIYPDNFRVECLNNKCETYKAIGIMVKKDSKVYIQYKSTY